MLLRVHHSLPVLLAALVLVFAHNAWPQEEAVIGSDSASSDGPITVYVASKIITMDPGLPEATAVAVRDGRIAAVGDLADLHAWTQRYPHVIDRTFENKVLTPGFVAAHEHPILAANTVTRSPLTAYYATPNPFGPDIAGVASRDEALARVQAVIDSSPESQETVFSWGYDVIAMGGHLTKHDLDALSTTRPIVIWDASVHFAYANSAYLRQRGVTAEDAARIPGIELGPDGQPNGQFLATAAAAYALVPEVTKAIGNMTALVDKVTALNRQAGITTTTELAFGALNTSFEQQFFPAYYNDPRIPLRIVVVADAATYAEQDGDDAIASVAALAEMNTDKVIFSGVKFFADDAFLGLAMALREPGYADPSLRAIWNTPPGELVDAMRPWWEAGFRIHIHSNGDAAQDAVLNALAEMQAASPRFDHRFVFEHFGLSTPDQIRRLKALGASASVNPSYVYLRGELNADYIGRNRAALASRLATLANEGVPTAIHSDLPVAPAEPLLLMWIAANRLGQSGQVLGPEERVTPEQALRMVTIDAAYVIGMDDRIGSIEPGKHADFTVLEENPLDVEPWMIRDIEVWGTVFAGKKYPAPEKASEAAPRTAGP